MHLNSRNSAPNGCFKLVCVIAMLGLPAISLPGIAMAQTLPLPLAKAIQATELPVGAWGCYARTHAGPCYQARRFPVQLLSFPIVVGQSRVETIRTMETGANGKRSLKSREVVIRRRSMGLSPVDAALDDIQPGAGLGRINRIACVSDADADGFLWTHKVEFEAAQTSQKLAPTLDPLGNVTTPQNWGAGTAKISCFPAFSDPGADGLLIRIELENSSDIVESFYVDLLAGIDTSTALFSADALQFDLKPDAIVMKHPGSDQVFCIGSRSAIAPRNFEVNQTYFSNTANVVDADKLGGSSPPGLRLDGDTSIDKTAKWGLSRLDSIAINAKSTQVIWLCVGVGKDAEAAITSQRTLLNIAEDAPVSAKIQRTGAYTRATELHHKSKFVSGNDVIDRLTSQMIVNTPSIISRRLGVPSRLNRNYSTYHTEFGGYTALGWEPYRPDWAAAQMNAWFATITSSDAPLSANHAIPTPDLFSAWQLYQQSGSESYLKAVYPYAHHRYLELVSASRLHQDGSWLFGWPIFDANGATDTKAPEVTVADPGCSARIAVSAEILAQVASIIHRPSPEIQSFLDDRTHVLERLNVDLWSDLGSMFHARDAKSLLSGLPGMHAATDNLAGLMPLICGADAFSPDRLTAMLKRLKDPQEFWSPNGIRSLSKKSANYKPEDISAGGVKFGDNLLLWQALVDLGETDTARSLAENLLTGYERAATASGGLPQWLNGETGAAAGQAIGGARPARMATARQWCLQSVARPATDDGRIQRSG